MKKSLIIILIIFVLPVLFYLFFQARTKSSLSFATTSNGNALVYKFESPMCSECQVVKKMLEKIQPDYDDITFKEINVAGNNAKKREVKDLISKYDVTVVPTLIFIDNTGHMHKKFEVDMTEDEIRSALNEISPKENK